MCKYLELIGNNNDLVYGRVPIIELLQSDKPIDKILVSIGEKKGSILKIIAMAKEKGITIKEVSKSKLDYICSNRNHQNVVAFLSACEYASLDDIFDLARCKNQKPFIIILAGIEDAHNVGAIIRSAEAAGAHGVIIPKRRSIGITPIVMKTSAGACGYIPIVKVANLNYVINDLKSKDIWIYCLDSSGKSWIEFDYKRPIAVIIGSEGKGVNRLIKENSDFIVSLPMSGHINSLNASVAAGVFMYEVVKQRLS